MPGEMGSHVVPEPRHHERVPPVTLRLLEGLAEVRETPLGQLENGEPDPFRQVGPIGFHHGQVVTALRLQDSRHFGAFLVGIEKGIDSLLRGR